MVAINPAVLNALTLDWNRRRADLDDQENRYRINYNSAVDKMKRTYGDTVNKNLASFSDRGMLQSGPAVENSVKLQEDLMRNQSEGAQALNTNLATLARRRLEADSQFKNEQLLASLGLK